MKVFISWSGEQSKAVAEALYQWIPRVIQSVEPFMSDHSINSGERWLTEINSRLEGTSFGVLCVTRANQASQWLNFEAGALAKETEKARVVPIAIDLQLPEIKIPLAQFNGVNLDREGIEKLMLSLNSVADAPLESTALSDSVDTWWPKLEDIISKIKPDDDASEPEARPDSEVLLEILETVRGLAIDRRRQYSPAALADGVTTADLVRPPSTQSLLAQVANELNATPHDPGALARAQALAEESIFGARRAMNRYVEATESARQKNAPEN